MKNSARYRRLVGGASQTIEAMKNPALRRGVVYESSAGVLHQEPHILPCLSQGWVLYGFQLSD